MTFAAGLALGFGLGAVCVGLVVVVAMAIGAALAWRAIEAFKYQQIEIRLPPSAPRV